MCIVDWMVLLKYWFVGRTFRIVRTLGSFCKSCSCNFPMPTLRIRWLSKGLVLGTSFMVKCMVENAKGWGCGPRIGPSL